MTHTSLRHFGRRAVSSLLDFGLLLGVATVVVVLVTGGGRIDVGGVRVSVRSLGNVLLALGALLALRSRLPDVPVLGFRGTTPTELADRCVAACRSLWAHLDALDARSAKRYLLVAAAVATAIRIGNALVHHGFITGDDVEIQEMSLGLALGRAWPVWDLRNAFYPICFIYPVQKALLALGVTDVFGLVLAGRVVVMTAAVLNLYLVYRVGTRLFAHRGQGLLASLLFAFSHLHMTYGSAELPRVVATAFVLAAFWVSLRPGLRRSAAAGALLGVAAALRFGEVVFLAPAALTALAYPGTPRAGRWSGLWRVAILGVACLATTLLIVGVADALYWGEAFHSLRAIVDYTLVKRLSSRGYEAAWYYLTHAPEWSNVGMLVLAALSMRRGGARVLTWAVVPILLLSALPHKEPRYVIATIPFWSLAAARGAWLALESVVAAGTPRRATAVVLMAIVAGSCVFDASRFRFHRSEGAVALGWHVAQTGERGLAADQLWRFGGRLYLGALEPLVDLDPARAADEEASRAIFCRGDLARIALRSDLITPERVRALETCGFGAELADASAGYRLFRRAPRAQ
jgi:hypothetical protein